MNYFVFQASNQSAYGKQRTAQEVFDYLVKDKSVWGFGQHTANRKAIQPGDKVLFYLTGLQVFAGAATLKTGTYEDETGESKDWYLDPDTLRIDLIDVFVFPEVKPRSLFKNIEWRPAQGGSNKISEQDYMVIMGLKQDKPSFEIEPEEEMEFALEKYLENFIIDNWDRIDFGEKLDVYKDEDGNIGEQYFTEDVGYIDILAQDKDKNFVIIELKKGRKNDEVVGQVLRYMGWVRNNLAKKGEKVRGIIIVGERDIKLEHALQEISDKVFAKIYNISFKLNDYKLTNENN